MKIGFNPAKRARNLAKHGLDLADAERVFGRTCLHLPDDREDYGEERIVSFGLLYDTVVVCVWTEREDERRIISLRKATVNEQKVYFSASYD